jgi:hypothetical protein
MADSMKPISSAEGLSILRSWHNRSARLLLETFKSETRQRREWWVTIASILEGSQSTTVSLSTTDSPSRSFKIELIDSAFFEERVSSKWPLILRTLAPNGDEIIFSQPYGD